MTQGTAKGLFWVELISKDALVQYMDFRGESLRSLAKKCGVTHGAIGNLTSGARRTCSPDLAKAIEEKLLAPRGSLFVGKTRRTRTT